MVVLWEKIPPILCERFPVEREIWLVSTYLNAEMRGVSEDVGRGGLEWWRWWEMGCWKGGCYDDDSGTTPPRPFLSPRRANAGPQAIIPQSIMLQQPPRTDAIISQCSALYRMVENHHLEADNSSANAAPSSMSWNSASATTITKWCNALHFQYFHNDDLCVL